MLCDVPIFTATYMYFAQPRYISQPRVQSSKRVSYLKSYEFVPQGTQGIYFLTGALLVRVKPTILSTCYQSYHSNSILSQLIILFAFLTAEKHRSRLSGIMYQHHFLPSSSVSVPSCSPHESHDLHSPTTLRDRFAVQQHRQRQYQQQFQHNRHDEDRTSVPFSAPGDIWQPGVDIYPSDYSNSSTDWSCPQTAEEYHGVPAAYGLPMTSVAMPTGSLWSNNLLTTTSGLESSVFALHQGFTPSSGWSHHDSLNTVSEAAPIQPRTPSSPVCASLDGHAHSDSGAQHSPNIKMEKHDVSLLHSFPAVHRTPRSHVYYQPDVLRTAGPISIKQEQISPSMMNQSSSPEYTSPTCSRKRKSAEVDDDSSEESGRAKRNYTTEANAKCQCDVCGKLFKRTFNLKAHREVHNPLREQPFSCEVPNCIKRFVRKTDLTRHHLSVSIFR